MGEYLIERLAHLPVEVEYASEFRYRNPPIDRNTVMLAITQSGETADTLAALRESKRMGHTTAAATGLVDRLENLHYLERSHATDDRRKVRVKITPKGQTLVTRIKQDVVQNLTSIMTHLTAAERKAWLQIYRKVHALCQSTDAQIVPLPPRT